MPSTRHQPGLCAVRRGFTLLELLVVIAIVMVLLGLLLPALGTARAVAHRAMCLGNLKQLGLAMLDYTSTNRGAIAGPMTSGARAWWTGQIGRAHPSEPTNTYDWLSPTLGREMGLPPDDKDRLVTLFNQQLRCPANSVYYDFEYSGRYDEDFVRSLRVNSYSSPLGFHMYGSYWTALGDGADDRGGKTAYRLDSRRYTDGKKAFETGSDPSDPGRTKNKAWRYAPRADLIGSASRKVMVMEGSRYVKDGRMSFNAAIDGDDFWGGNFLNRGASFNAHNDGNGSPYYTSIGNNDPDQLAPDADARTYAYRHFGQMHAVTFDGAARGLTVRASRDLDLWFPPGYVVKFMWMHGDPDIRSGYTVR